MPELGLQDVEAPLLHPLLHASTASALKAEVCIINKQKVFDQGHGFGSWGVGGLEVRVAHLAKRDSTHDLEVRSGP